MSAACSAHKLLILLIAVTIVDETMVSTDDLTLSTGVFTQLDLWTGLLDWPLTPKY